MPASPATRPPPAELMLLGRDDCARTAELRGLLARLGVPFTYVPLEATGAPDDPCGYVSPSLQIAAVGRPAEWLVQPPVPAVLDALARHGWTRSAPRADRRPRAADPFACPSAHSLP